MFNSFWKYLGYEEISKSPNTVDESRDKPKSRSNTINFLEKNKDPKNFYYLSLINEDHGEWSIHGLWPQYTVKKYPRFCKNAVFDIKKLNPILDDLKEKWYSNKGYNSIFWEHEYLKHGTCNFNQFDEFTYFKTSLELFDKAISLKLPDAFYDPETDKCLIPVDKNLNFFTIE